MALKNQEAGARWSGKKKENLKLEHTENFQIGDEGVNFKKN